MRRLTHRSLTLLSVFHLSIASRKDFNDFSTALFFPRASAVPEMTMHRGCADAIVHGVLQQGDDHQGDAWAHLSAPSFRQDLAHFTLFCAAKHRSRVIMVLCRDPWIATR